MTFSADVKNTLAEIKASKCCKLSELYGMMVFSDRYDSDGICFLTENSAVFNRFIHFFSSVCGIAADEAARFCTEKTSRKIFLCEDLQIIKKLCSVYGNADVFNCRIIEKPCCKQAFVRGIFAASGYVSDPKKAYHAEMRIHNNDFIEPVLDAFAALDLTVRVSHRGSENFFYLKTAEDVSDLLVCIGDKEHAFDYLNAEIEKNIRNDVNRARNCDCANVKKQVIAVSAQLAAIEKLKKRKYAGLSDELVKTAEIRLKYREMSLEELGAEMSPPLSKSGMAYRLRKLEALAEKE